MPFLNEKSKMSSKNRDHARGTTGHALLVVIFEVVIYSKTNTPGVQSCKDINQKSYVVVKVLNGYAKMLKALHPRHGWMVKS